jgi:hypothetical protein
MRALTIREHGDMGTWSGAGEGGPALAEVAFEQAEVAAVDHRVPVALVSAVNSQR